MKQTRNRTHRRFAKKRPAFRDFKNARAYIWSLDLPNATAFRNWARSKTRPKDIPTNPHITYKEKGWIDWGDWLGTGTTATSAKKFLKFQEARKLVQSLGLSGEKAWRIWARSSAQSAGIPAAPDRIYKESGWKNWGDFLGTGSVSPGTRKFRSFEKARSFVRSLNLKGQKDWVKWSKSDSRPEDIPAGPHTTYKDKGWKGYGDWLGSGRLATKDMQFLAFERAKDIVHKLNLKSSSEWRQWAKSRAKPANIPSNPQKAYRHSGWKNMGDWLGTGRIADQYRVFRPFVQARDFVRSLRLKSGREWRDYCRGFLRNLPTKPSDIPNNPRRTYSTEWVGIGDWLGTDSLPSYGRKYQSFKTARDFSRGLGLKTFADWRRWSKTPKKPSNIPSNPQTVYKNEGWKGWGDWLGTGAVSNRKIKFRSFAEAREYSRNLGFSGKKKWQVWAKSEKRPHDIPSAPDRSYKNKGWTSWGDWLGTNFIHTHRRTYRDFVSARLYMHSLKLKGQQDWLSWVRSPKRPADIPTAPHEVYKKSGWVSYGDWLGTGFVSTHKRTFRPFLEARKYVRNLKLNGNEQWRDWAKSADRPSDIPATPEQIYKDNGWIGYGDWLGSVAKWNRAEVLGFLKSIEPILPSLKPIELFAIMRQNGMLSALAQETKVSEILKSLRDLCSLSDPSDEFEKLISRIDDGRGEEFQANKTDYIIVPNKLESEGLDDSGDLPNLTAPKDLESVDMLTESGLVSDEETVEFLISNRVSDLWQKILNDPRSIDLKELRSRSGGIYFQKIKSRFFAQYEGAMSLVVPNGYDFKIAGSKVEPNLMQRLTAFRVLSEKRIGNWSGVGAGKTVSAILSSRVIGAKLTVIVAFNSTIDGWSRAISEVFPKSKIHKKETGRIDLDPTRPNYVLLNFEKFQQQNSARLVRRLAQEHRIEFVVLDEIQNVKQRNAGLESLRRKLVKTLLSQAADKNPNLHVLGMSATPVINNLFEGKALLELVTGFEFQELKTTSTIANASALHEKLILHGIRYRPVYSQTIATHYPIIDGQNLLPRLLQASNEGLIATEQILLEAKLSTVSSLVKRGTLIYTHYKSKMVPKIQNALQKSGFSTGLFTGDDKTGLEAFLSGKIDVLIGTAPVGTGVDRLQFVCNRLIIVSLPWTSAEYEQLIGRLYRQGSKFREVDIFVPQVLLRHRDEEWSWDQLRMRRIQFKKTLADAAIDGAIPEGALESEKVMFEKARQSLIAWITRIQDDQIFSIPRVALRIPLDDTALDQGVKRYGEFSAMNARINSSSSGTTHERLRADPSEWYVYHSLFRKARESWKEIPVEQIAVTLKQRSDWIVGDFGCGEAKLRELIPNKVISLDHVAVNEHVIACDMKNVPLDTETLDVAVFSLSLMGINFLDYLLEAHRTLRFGGLLKIVEPSVRWNNNLDELLHKIRKAGFRISGEPLRSNQFIYLDAIKL